MTKSKRWIEIDPLALEANQVISRYDRELLEKLNIRVIYDTEWEAYEFMITYKFNTMVTEKELTALKDSSAYLHHKLLDAYEKIESQAKTDIAIIQYLNH